MAKDATRVVLSGEIEIVLMYSHEGAHKPHESAELTALLTHGDDVLAGIEGHAANTWFAPAPLAIDVVLSSEGLQLGADIDRIWGSLLFPVSTPREPIDAIRAFLHGRAGIRLVDATGGIESPVVTDNSLPALGLGGRVRKQTLTTSRSLPTRSFALRRDTGREVTSRDHEDSNRRRTGEARNDTVDKTLYTAWFDQGGGKAESRTVAVLVAYAESEEQMRSLFRERHGFEAGKISTGIVENEYTEFALSKPVLSEAKLAKLLGGRVNIEIDVRVRLNGPADESRVPPNSSEAGQSRVR